MKRPLVIGLLVSAALLIAGYFSFRAVVANRYTPQALPEQGTKTPFEVVTGGRATTTDSKPSQNRPVREDFSYNFWVDSDKQPVFTIQVFSGGVSFVATYPDKSCEFWFDYEAKENNELTVFPVVAGQCYDHVSWYTLTGAIRDLEPGKYQLMISPLASSSQMQVNDLLKTFEVR